MPSTNTRPATEKRREGLGTARHTEKGTAGSTECGRGCSLAACVAGITACQGSKAGPEPAPRALSGASKPFLNVHISIPLFNFSCTVHRNRISHPSFPAFAVTAFYVLSARIPTLLVREQNVWLPWAPQRTVTCRQHLGATHTCPSAEKSAICLVESLDLGIQL